MRILVIGDPHGKLPTKIPKADLILVTGDIGKANLARKKAFENIERKKKGLPKIDKTARDVKQIYDEIYYSSLKVIKRLVKIAPVYSIKGNVGATNEETKKDSKKYHIKLSLSYGTI